MELQQLEYFRTVAETGSITAAAKSLYISPPALSASVSRLEKDLGIRLFDRVSNHIVLNRQGEIFLRCVDRIFSEIAGAREEMTRSLSAAPRQVRIAETTSGLWIPLISAFSLKHPQIALSNTTLRLSQVRTDDLLDRYAFLFAEKGDFGEACPDCLCGESLFDDAPLLLVSENDPLAARESVSPQELRGSKLFLPMDGQSLNRRIRSLLSDAGIPLLDAYECADTVCRSMAEEGRGIAFSTVRAGIPGSPKIHCVPIRAAGCCWTQMLYWHRDRTLKPAEETFRDFVTDFYRRNKSVDLTGPRRRQ